MCGAVSISAIDLFCGVGGLTRGISDSGINVAAGVDIDENCRYAYEHNNNSKFINTDISKLKKSDLMKFYKQGDVKVLVGCAPCQPFSSNTPRQHAGRNNNKWGMLYEYARIVEELRPDIISMENVPQLKNTEPFNEFITVLENNHYHYSFSIVNCEEYGIPQRRKRLVLLASLYGPIYLNSPDGIKRMTVKDAIGLLPPINDGETSKIDPLHRCQKLSEINKKRIQHSRPGGSWEDWPEELILSCHKKTNGTTYRAVYGRMRWDEPAPTMTTEFFNYGSGRFGHPEQDRALSLREGALIQTFPSNYEFTENNVITSVSTTATHIGNAVPVKLGEIIGKSILDHLNKQGVANE